LVLINNRSGIRPAQTKNHPKTMNYSLMNVLGNKEIVADSIFVFSPTGEVIVCQNFKDYLAYLDDLENHDTR
jgi:hypothetical protein